MPFLLLPLRATDVICACRWLRFLLLSFALRSTWPHESVCRARPPRFARGIAAPPGALFIGVLQERRHIPCRVMQVAETHSSQLSNSTTPLRQWSPSLILQGDPSMSPPSRPLHKRREQTESSAQFFPIFPGCNRVLSLFLGPSGPRWCGWPARSSCYPMRHRFCRAAHVLMVDAARFGPRRALPSQGVSWSRSRSAVVLLSLPFLLLPLRAAAF